MNFTDNSDPDIDALLSQMAKDDGYDARKFWPITDRLLRDDVRPCEDDTLIGVVYEREPVTSREDMKAVAFTVAMAGLVLAGLLVLWWIRAGNSQ